ncbi:MAG TPA: DUF3298 domain-containing protein [Candidatus Paceibacterota bacterium]|nr:DUF3298 domain-containing protein [Candidatus Paceibacterota bacterium]
MNAKGKLVGVILVLLVIAGAFWFLREKPVVDTTIPPETPSIEIGVEEINEEFFSGTRPIISGGGALGDAVRNHIEKIVAEFKVMAMEQVPEMRAQFGEDSPTATYTIDIRAQHIVGEKTESILVSEYYYTGGANGMSLFTAFTASIESGRLLSLSDVIREERKEDFASVVRSKLMSYAPNGNTAPVVFSEDVATLKFEEFKDWAIDDTSLILYFDKYEVGPGALGAFEFPIPFGELSGYLVSDFAPAGSLGSLEGCYVSRLGQDVYTLRVENEQNGYVSGFLSYNNFEKDSSSGPFVGTYKDNILLADYSFHSEGMFSIRQVIFKKIGETFIEGFGAFETVENKERFTNLDDITYESKLTFAKEDCSE